MTLICAVCGGEMVSDMKLSDGQTVQCPHCGEKTIYRKPTRIELPSAGAAPTKANKPTLHVIRKDPPGNPSQSSQNSYFENRLHMAEEHVRFYENMKDQAHRRQQRGKIMSLFMLVALCALCLGIYYFIDFRREKQKHSELAVAAERAKQEQERAMQEAELANAMAQRKAAEKIAREKRDAELKAEEAKQRAEREKTEKALLEAKIHFRKTVAALCDGKFNIVKDLPKNLQVGKCDAEFSLLLPFLENGDIVVCQSKKDGNLTAVRFSPSGAKMEMNPDVVLSVLKSSDYLAAVNGQTYFRSKRQKPHIGQIEKTKVIDLQKEFFGDVYSEVKQYGIYPDGLCFDIVFIPKGSKRTIVTQTVENGVAYSLDAVRDAVEDAFPLKERVGKNTKPKPKFKRTVIVYDGPSKRSIDGIEYVSRIPPPLKSDRTYWIGNGYQHWYHNDSRRREISKNARERWQTLYNEGMRQEQAEREFYAKLNEEEKSARDRQKSANEQAYAAKIDRILEEGSLYYRAKIQGKLH